MGFLTVEPELDFASSAHMFLLSPGPVRIEVKHVARQSQVAAQLLPVGLNLLGVTTDERNLIAGRPMDRGI